MAIGYFCISNSGREFLYVPFNLLAYDSTRSHELNFHWDPDTLSKLTLLLKEGRLYRERLEDKGWEIYDVDVPDGFLKKFRSFCRKKNGKKSLNLAVKIFNYIEDFYDSLQEDDEPEVSQEDEDYYGYEDYLDDWWLRGEDPPFYMRDKQ